MALKPIDCSLIHFNYLKLIDQQNVITVSAAHTPSEGLHRLHFKTLSNVLLSLGLQKYMGCGRNIFENKTVTFNYKLK